MGGVFCIRTRQAEDTFKTVREPGRMVANPTLHQIGDIGERRHASYVKEANGLVQHMFVERVAGLDGLAQPSAIRINART